ncbi:MAG: CHASE2 domain-containing protein [Planctomycetota bacterium]|nr:MAG: CHASE2 domain-containing protein [Planctomycetota bacterium]
MAFAAVRGIQIDEQGVRSLVEQVGIEGVTPGQIATYRPLHGYLLSKLAEARPSVVAIDIAFADRDDPGDAAMVEGIQTLRDGGCQVVLALYNWPSQTPDPVTLDTDILADHPRGAPTGEFLRTGWRLDTAARLPGDGLASPSFALAAVAAKRMPTVPYIVRIDPARAQVVLSPSTTDMSVGRALRTEHRLGVSFVRLDAGVAGVLPRGTEVAYSVLDVPPVEAIDEATINIADLPGLTPGQLSELFYQRIVVVGQSVPFADRVVHPSGGTVEGFKAQMVAIEAARPEQDRAPGRPLPPGALGRWGRDPRVGVRVRRAPRGVDSGAGLDRRGRRDGRRHRDTARPGVRFPRPAARGRGHGAGLPGGDLGASRAVEQRIPPVVQPHAGRGAPVTKPRRVSNDCTVLRPLRTHDERRETDL